MAALFDEARTARNLETPLVQRVRDRIYIPGFGHRLYPDGDVRSAILDKILRETVPDSPELAFAAKLAAAVEHLIDRTPNIDFTTVVVERVLGLPKDPPWLSSCWAAPWAGSPMRWSNRRMLP